MEIDSYQQCPCQSGKKIKFCCGKDLVHDLNTVLSKERAGQSIAALEYLERTIKKVGPRECLLTIQTHILIAHGDIDEARASNATLLQHHPGHITGLQHQALIDLADGEVAKAIDKLQDTMDAITGNELPISVANAFRAVGVGLLNDGNLIAGRAHLKFALDLKGGNDQELTRMLFDSFRFQGLPLLLKRDFDLAEPPAEDVEWHKKYVNVHRALARGQFRKALKFLNKIDASFPDQPMVVEALAMVSAYLGQQGGLSEKFRRYSTLSDLTPWQQIEAEGLAQAVDTEPQVPTVEMLRISFEIADVATLNETATSSDRLVPGRVDETDPFGEGPAPKHTYFLLDKTIVRESADVTTENVPSVLAEFKLYGKQTDRAARLELLLADDDRLVDSIPLLREIFGADALDEKSRTPVGSVGAIDRLLRVDWHLPKGTSRSQFNALMKQRAPALFQEWADLPFRALGDKSVRACAGDAELALPVQTLVVQLRGAVENIADGQGLLEQFLKEINVSLPAKSDPTQIKTIQSVSPFRQQFLDFGKLTEDQISYVHQSALMLGNVAVMRLSVDEMLGRDDFDLLPRDVLYSMKAQVTDGDDEALDYIAKAREEGTKKGAPVGMFLVHEFEMRLSRGLTEKLPTLLQTIRSKHLHEPNVEAELAQVLHSFGLLDQEQLLSAPAPGAPAMAGAATMPPMAAGATPAEAAAPEEPSKLWLPD